MEARQRFTAVVAALGVSLVWSTAPVMAQSADSGTISGRGDDRPRERPRLPGQGPGFGAQDHLHGLHERQPVSDLQPAAEHVRGAGAGDGF